MTEFNFDLNNFIENSVNIQMKSTVQADSQNLRRYNEQKQVTLLVAHSLPKTVKCTYQFCFVSVFVTPLKSQSPFIEGLEDI